MCSAPYVFTKVLRQLVKYWRGRGHLTLIYLDEASEEIRLLIAPKALVIQFAKTLFRPVSHLKMINVFGSLHQGTVFGF